MDHMQSVASPVEKTDFGQQLASTGGHSNSNPNVRKVIEAQAREIINNVCLYFDKEKNHGQPLLPVQNSVGRAAAATGVSARTIHRIKRQIRTSGNGKVRGPCKKRHRPPVFQFTVADVELMRKTMVDVYLESLEAVPLHRIVERFKTAMDFDGSLQTMRKALSNIGFRSKRVRNNKSFFAESEDIVCLRRDYLTKMRAFRSETPPRRIVYVDETAVTATRAAPRCWQANNLERCDGGSANEEDVKRLYVIHAAGQDGFLPNGLCTFHSGRSHSTSGGGDKFQGEMTSNNFERYFAESLLPNLFPGTVIVLDDAAYHSAAVEEWPSVSWTRHRIAEWLRARKTDFNAGMLKAELLRLAKGHPHEVKYRIDELAAHCGGHVVLRLPPCHPELNPLETTWTDLKSSLAASGDGGKNLDVHSRELQDAVSRFFGCWSEVRLEDWSVRWAHVASLETDYWEKDIKLDAVMEQIVSTDKEKVDVDDEDVLVNMDSSDPLSRLAAAIMATPSELSNEGHTEILPWVSATSQGYSY